MRFQVEEGIATLQAKYEECVQKKEDLEFKTDLCQQRLIRADKVTKTVLTIELVNPAHNKQTHQRPRVKFIQS